MASNALALKYGEAQLGAAALGRRAGGVVCRMRKRNWRCESDEAEPDQYVQCLIRLRITHLSPPRSIFSTILHQSTAVRTGLCVDHVAEPFFNGAPVEQVVRSLES